MLKKAQESAGRPVNLIVILLAIGVVAFVLLFVWMPKLYAIPDKELCRQSVIWKAKSKIMGMESDIPLNCHTNYITVKKDGIYGGGGDVGFRRSDSREDKEEKIKRYIANEMYDCWYRFERGTVDPWGDWHAGTTVHCLICADIAFDSEFSEEISKINDMGLFLNEEEYAEGKKYADYLGGDVENFYIDTSQSHLVLFKMHDAGLGAQIGGAGGVICGASIAAAIFGPIGAGVAVVGCAVGFVGSTYTFMIHDTGGEVKLHANVILMPSEVVDAKMCSVLG